MNTHSSDQNFRPQCHSCASRCPAYVNEARSTLRSKHVREEVKAKVLPESTGPCSLWAPLTPTTTTIFEAALTNNSAGLVETLTALGLRVVETHTKPYFSVVEA